MATVSTDGLDPSRNGEPKQSTNNDESDLFSFTPPKDSIKLNLRGVSYEMRLQHLLRHPDTLLGRMAEKAKSSMDEGRKVEVVHFDRDPSLFNSILNYYVTGQLHFHSYICMEELQEELKFWQIEMMELADCCWSRVEEELAMDENIHKVAFTSDNLKGPVGCRARLHKFLNYPASSMIASVWSILIIVAVVTSLLCLALETSIHVPPPSDKENFTTKDRLLMNSRPLWIIWLENTANTVLTLELLLQLVAAPAWYLCQATTWLEMLGVLPIWPASIILYLLNNGYISGTGWQTVNLVLRNMKVLRILQLFRLMKASSSFNILTLAWKKSLLDTMLLVILVMATATFFGTIIFFVELSVETFDSIPEGMWWALVTITTVGYGDYYPVTGMGRVIGGACAVIGILVVATPIPIIVDKFKKLYDAKHIADSIAKKKKIKEIRTTEKYRKINNSGETSQHKDVIIQRLTCNKQTQTLSEVNEEKHRSNGSVPHSSEIV